MGVYSARFSPAVNVLTGMFLVVALGAMVWLSASIPKLERVEAPERALTLTVSRLMDVQVGVQRAPDWKRTLFLWISGNSEAERLQAIEWLQELAEVSDDSLVPVELAVLQAESGHVSQALTSVQELVRTDESLSTLADLISVAYTNALAPDKATFDAWQRELADRIPAGWFYDRLAERLAQRVGDEPLVQAIHAAAAPRVDRQFARAWRLAALELMVMAIGTVILVWLWITRARVPSLVRLHEPGVPPPWPGRVGAAVLLRGGAL
ncbi:MAG TPA: hypothetical protein VH681_02900, partial [Nitrospiraceae bacterium]